MTGNAGSRDYRRNPQSPQRTPQISTHPMEKQTPTLSPELFLEGRILFFSGMCGYVWGHLRILRGPNVIPRPGVPRHNMNPQSTHTSEGHDAPYSENIEPHAGIWIGAEGIENTRFRTKTSAVYTVKLD